MSFFDEGDEPRTRTQRAARPSGGSRSAAGAGAAADPQTVRNRRIVAAVLVVLFVVLLSFLVNSCLDTRAENRLKDYNRDVGSVVGRSDRDVGRPFFDLISQGGQAPNELEQNISSLRNRADEQVQQAEDFDVPDELRTAQRNLLLTLDMRAAALEKIAGQVRTALVQDGGEEAEAATQQIAAQMQQFLASDVVYAARVVPFIQDALDEKEIGGQTIAGSQFLPSVEWLDVEVVADRLGAEAGDGGGAGTRGEPAPGLHGHGLVSVRVGDLALEPSGGTPNRIPASSDLSFDVEFANQGDNEERNVTVRVRIRSPGAKTISATRRVEQTEPGTNATASVPLQQSPPLQTPVTIEVEVVKVPGERTADNNRQVYPAIFLR